MSRPNKAEKALIIHLHKGLVLNGILPILVGVKYLTLIEASSGYYNLKLVDKSSYLTTFLCPFDR